MFNKLKQYKDLKDQAKSLQNALSSESVTVQQDGIVMTMDGNQKVTSLKISASLTPERIEQIMPDLFNQAVTKVQKIIAQKMQSGEFQMPQI